jgi:hypothetical protein
VNGEGRNMLGEMLMELRAKLALPADLPAESEIAAE